MASKFERHLKKEISSGKFLLPDDLGYLSRVDFFAIAQQPVAGVRKWHIEVSASSFEGLLKSKKKLGETRSRVRILDAEILQLKEKLHTLQQDYKKLEVTNARLMKNIDEDKSPDKFARSKSNYFIAAEKYDFTATSPLPLQGGSTGLEKK